MLVFPFFGRSQKGRRRAQDEQGEDRKESGSESLSVIVPAYNEEANISVALRSAQTPTVSKRSAEIIVVDGGSTDKTCEIARSMGARVIKAPRGRATQMNAGARAANGDLLLFLHSDCILPPGYQGLIFAAMRQPAGELESPTRGAASTWNKAAQATSKQGPPLSPGWGAFAKLTLEGPGFGLRMVEKGVEMRTRWKHLPYGDQGIFVHRQLFEEVGGYREMPLMEDYQFVQDLGKHSAPRLVDAAITASARRWEKKGVLQTTITNQIIILAYKLGVPPTRLAEWYRGKQ